MTVSLPALIERPLTGLDAIRGRVLSIAAPLAPSLFRDRERRIAAYALASIATAALFTFFAPMLLLALGPVLLGVPHLVADVRYLVVRPGLHRRLEVAIFVLGPACAAFFYSSSALAMVAVIGAALAARAPRAGRAAVALVGCGLVYAALRLGRTADVAIAHLHNAIAVALFCAWSYERRPRRVSSGPVVLAFAGVLAAIALGAFDGLPAHHLTTGTLLSPVDLRDVLAPIHDETLATRAILAFAFAQSVHYAVWLRLVPERDRSRPGLRSFSSSVRALVSDLGFPIIVAAAALTIGVTLLACISIAAARDGYLRLAIFHGPLELGAATLLLLENGALRATRTA